MLENRDDLLELKKAELISIIVKTNSSLQEENINAKEIMQNLLKSGGLLITPPQQKSSVIGLMTIDSLKNYNRGESIKPGNIVLNMHLLIKSLPTLTIDIVSIMNENNPILKVCAALNIWIMIRDLLTIEITKVQAITIIALWENCDQNHQITLEKGFECFKSLYETIEATEGTEKQYKESINRLNEIGSLELEDNNIWLCEWVSKSYTE